MTRWTAFVLATAFVGLGTPTDAQPRNQNQRQRLDAARAQGIPPGHMPPPNECRVWYDDRPNGRQPAPTSCARAESLAVRDADARVIYGRDVFWTRDAGGAYGTTDRAVRRGTVRDPRLERDDDFDPWDDQRRGRDNDGNVAFRNGYRDGLTKGRADFENRDVFDATRHSWYRMANRGYDYKHGTRYDYISDYRRGFETGYSEGYRLYRRR